MSDIEKLDGGSLSEQSIDPVHDDGPMPSIFDALWRQASPDLDSDAPGDQKGNSVAGELPPRAERPEAEAQIAASGLRFNLDAREIANLSSTLGQTYKRFAATKQELELRVQERTRGLQEARNRLEIVIDSISDALIGFNSNGRIESINRAAENLFGFQQAEVAEQLVSKLLPTLDATTDPCGESIVILGTKADGSTFQAEGSIRTMELDGKRHFVAALRDITSAKYTQKRLKEQAFLIERSKSFVLNITAEREVQWCNPCFEELTGYKLEQIAGEPIVQRILSPDTPTKTLNELEEARRQRLPFNGDLVLRHITGRPFWVHVEAHPIFDEDGSLEKYVALGVDITWRKRQEQQQVDFVSMVSHELRTPLTVVSGSLDAIESSFSANLPDMAKTLLDMGQRNCAHLSRLIEDLLDINKLEAGIIRFQSQSVSLQEVLLDSIRTITSLAVKADVTITQKLNIDDQEVFVDPQRLKQVILNLLSNAVKFSKPGSDVEIRAERQGGMAAFWVEDHGLGMSADFQRRAFERFARDEAAQANGIEGFGLGLSISKGLIEQMDGKISFESVEGEGTTFYVCLPTVQEVALDAIR